MAYTTDDLITAVKRDSFLPAAQTQWTDARILAVADKCVHRRIIPAFIGVADGFYRETVNITLVAEQASYDVPQYAVLNKIHQAKLASATTSAARLGELLRKEPSDLAFWNATTSGSPYMLRFDADQLTLNPAPSASAIVSWPYLRVWIYRRPGRMVTVASAAQVLSIDTGTGEVTYTGNKPATFTSSSTHDVYRSTSPFRRVITAAVASASGSATTQTFSTTNAALLQAGDWICVADETVYPPCSIEVVPFLEELIIKSMSTTQGDRKAADAAAKEIVDDMMLLVSAAANRADAMPQVQSLLRSPFVRALGRKGARSTLT